MGSAVSTECVQFTLPYSAKVLGKVCPCRPGSWMDWCIVVSVVHYGRASVQQRYKPRPSPGRSPRTGRRGEINLGERRRGEERPLKTWINHNVMKHCLVNNRADMQLCSQACNHQLAEYLRLVWMLFIETVQFSLRLSAAMFFSLASLPFEGILCYTPINLQEVFRILIIAVHHPEVWHYLPNKPN